MDCLIKTLLSAGLPCGLKVSDYVLLEQLKTMVDVGQVFKTKCIRKSCFGPVKNYVTLLLGLDKLYSISLENLTTVYLSLAGKQHLLLASHFEPFRMSADCPLNGIFGEVM